MNLVQERLSWRELFEMGFKPFMLTHYKGTNDCFVKVCNYIETGAEPDCPKFQEYKQNRLSTLWRASRVIEQFYEYALWKNGCD